MKIFDVEPNNQYSVLCLENYDDNYGFLSGKEFRSLLDEWQPLSFFLHLDKKELKKGWCKQPDK